MEITNTISNLTILNLTDASKKYQEINSGTSSYIFFTGILVMLMTPALGFFYSGFASNKRIVMIVGQCFAIYSIISIIWYLIGFSLVFGNSQIGLIGDLSLVFLNNLNNTVTIYAPEVSAYNYFFFQSKFATITPALIIGSTAGRLNFFSILIFCCLWAILVYCPIAHWVWNCNGFLKEVGMVDFAGGVAVHVSSGFAGLSSSITCDRISSYNNLEQIKESSVKTSNLILTIGTLLLWFGWFGFNGGSGTNLTQQVLAIINTHISACTGALIYFILGLIVEKKPTNKNICIGVICGLIGITPGAGLVPVYASFIIGLVSAISSYLMCHYRMKYSWYDDRLDVFGCHGVSGAIGTIFTGLFVKEEYAIVNGLVYDNPKMLGFQIAGVLCCAGWSFVISAFILTGMYLTKILKFNQLSDFKEVGFDTTNCMSEDVVILNERPNKKFQIYEKKEKTSLDNIVSSHLIINIDEVNNVKNTQNDDEINQNLGEVNKEANTYHKIQNKLSKKVMFNEYNQDNDE